MSHMEMYFAIRNYIALGLSGFAVVLTILLIIIDLLGTLSLNRKFRHLEKVGFERHLISVASVGDHSDWGWRRTRVDGSWEIISDTEVKKDSLARLKKKYTEK